MKLLFDQNLSFKLCDQLDDVFPQSTQVRLVSLDTADDRAVWDYAKQNGFTLITQDSDFSEMAALWGPPPKVIWLRSGNLPTAAIAKLLRDHGAVIREFETDKVSACLEIF